MNWNLTVPVILIALFSLPDADGQSLRYTITLPYTGLSAYSVLQPDPLSFTSNQAALGAIKQAGIGVYGERRFLLGEVSCYNLAASFPSKMGNFGVQINYSGFKSFNENKIGFAYGTALGSKLAIGTQFNYYSYHVPGYNSFSAINFEGGLIMHFTDKLNGGFHVYNPVVKKSVGEKLPMVYKMGLGYDASPNFFISSEIVKEEDKPVNIITGMQYHFAKQFFARFGLMSASSVLFMGAGVGWANMRVDIAGSYHPQLGFSPGILLIASFENKNKPDKHKQ